MTPASGATRPAAVSTNSWPKRRASGHRLHLNVPQADPLRNDINRILTTLDILVPFGYRGASCPRNTVAIGWSRQFRPNQGSWSWMTASVVAPATSPDSPRKDLATQERAATASCGGIPVAARAGSPQRLDRADESHCPPATCTPTSTAAAARWPARRRSPPRPRLGRRRAPTGPSMPARSPAATA